MPLDNTSSWITALPEVTDHPAAAGGAPPAVPQYPRVPVHPAPDNPNALTDLSDEDYASFMAGKPLPAPHAGAGSPAGAGGTASADNNSWITSLPEVTDHPAAAPPTNQNGGVFANIGAGTNQAITGMLGAPVDLANAAMSGLDRLRMATGGIPSPFAESDAVPIGGSQWIKNQEAKIGISPDQVAATNQVDRLARAGGAGVAGMILPWAAARAAPAIMGALAPSAASAIPGAVTAAPKLAGIPGAMVESFGAGGAPTMAATGFAGGVAGQEAEDSVPDPWKPWANFAGNIVGGLPVIGARALLGKAADIAAPVARNATAPLTDAGQQRLAAERVIGAMSDPDAVRTTLANPAPDLVPGSSATPYQLTADRGLGTLERGVSRNARYAPGFDQLRGEQNAARIAAIEGANPPQSWVLRTDSGDVPVTPSGHEFTTSNGQVYSEITTSDGRVGMIPKDNLVQVGDVSSIVPWFRSQLAAADAEDEAAISGNRNAARSAVDAIGTPTTPHTAGAAVRQGVEATAAPALAQSDAEIAAAQRDAEAALARQGGDQGTTLQDHGARIRGGIEAERAPVKTAGKRLLDAVDPDRNLVVGGLDSVADTAALLKGDRSPRGGWKVDNADHLSDIAADGDDDLAPAERAVLNRVSQLGDAETFQNLRRQTRRIATAQRAFARDPALGRESLPYARMTALRGAIEDALARTVGEKAESDAAAVSAGKMKPEDSIQGRLFGPEGLASGRRLPIPPVAGPDLFGTSSPEPISRTQEPLIRNDARQITMPGLDPSARQARAARDAAGPRGDQKPADQGLFGRKEAVQPELEGERGKPRAPNVPPSGAQREGLQPGFDRKTIAAPHPESNGPDLSHLTPIQRDIVRGTDLHGYDPETAAGIRTRLLSHLPTTDPQAALRTANFEKFLRDNGIAHTVENSQSISGQFGPSASRYYKLSNGATIRLSDHSYPSSATIDLRYGEPQGAAFDRVLRAANLPPISRWAPNTHASRTFTDTLPQVQGQGHEAAASHVFDLGRTTGHEHIAVVDNATGQVVHAGTESLPAQVGFSHANTAGAATDAFTIHHNHPNSTALSREDVSMLANPGISHVVAHGHDGLTTTASLSPRMAALRSPAEIGENALGITLAYKKAQRIAQDILLPLRDAGRITATQASQAYNDVANRLLHASGWLNYTSTLDLGADVRAAINAELKKPGYAPDALDDRYTVAVRPEGRIASLPQKHDDGAGQGLARGQGSDSGSAGVSDARGQNPTDAPRGLREDSGDNDAHTANGRTSVYTPAGRKIPVQYRVVETDSLTPSHTDDLKVNPAYPPELQPRDRTRAASQEQVQKIAGNLNPERLGPSPSTMEGAPVVSNGVVVSGNGRTLALRHVYANNPESAQRYRAYLESLGYDTKGIEKPILVGDMGPAPHGDLVRIAQESNTSPGLAMGAAERAGVDAGRMSDDLLGKWKPGDVDSGVNSDFVRSFIEHVPDASERGGFYTPDGNLSLEGIQRIRNALLQRAYGDPKLVSALSEVGDESIRGFGNALSDAAGDMARLKADIAAGRVDPGTDLSPHLLDAARIVSQARRRGISLQKMAAQTDMLAGRIDPLTMSVLRAAYGPNLTGRISRAKMSELLAYYADQASKATTGPSLFGDIKPPTAAEIFQRGISRAGSEPTLRATDSAGRAGSTESYGAGAGQVGDQGRRSGNGAGRAGNYNISRPRRHNIPSCKLWVAWPPWRTTATIPRHTAPPYPERHAC